QHRAVLMIDQVLAQREGRYRVAGQRFRILAADLRRDPVERLLRLRRADAVTKTAIDGEVSRAIGRVDDKGDPEVGFVREFESLWEHADDGEGAILELDGRVQRRTGAAKPPLPEAIADDRGAAVDPPAFFRGRKVAS